MKSLVTLIAFAVLTSPAVAPPAGAESVDQQIAEAVLPLPEDLRAEATVFTYDPDTGERTVLRKGTNHVECKTREEDTTWCYPIATRARRDLRAKLEAQGKSDEEVRAALEAATEAGKIEPTPYGSILYRAYAKEDRIQLLWVVLLPGAKAEDLAMSTVSQRDSSLAGKGLPWMMREGTPGAHLMIPINATELSSKGGAMTRMDTKAITDPVAHSVLPLPEELRAGATVVTYDSKTGARKVLRQGTNVMECATRNADGFTRCYHQSMAPRSDLIAKLRAEGKSPEEIQEAVLAAYEAGTIPSPRPGSMAYRLYEENDRIKLLWVMLLPGKTSDELGMSTGSQRDNSLAGKGRPWMMREGEPNAHLMIPINATELSNPKN